MDLGTLCNERFGPDAICLRAAAHPGAHAVAHFADDQGRHWDYLVD